MRAVVTSRAGLAGPVRLGFFLLFSFVCLFSIGFVLGLQFDSNKIVKNYKIHNSHYDHLW
jgi:hypothetical protein